MQVSKAVIAHRGASAYAPENTLASFDKALSLGCRFVEFDVMLSADLKPFVFHDDHLKRTSNGRGKFAAADAAYLSSLDAGAWFSKRFSGEKIPHFQEVLQWLSLKNVQANIEIKPCPNLLRETVVAVLSEINGLWPASHPSPLVSSFDQEALYLCRELAPELPLGLLLDSWDKDWLKTAKALACYSIHINQWLLNAKRITEIKKEGFQLYAYTVNRKRQAKKLLSAGVDAIFSDYPDLLS